MAKRFEPFPSEEIPVGFDAVVGVIEINGVSVARRFIVPVGPGEEYLAEQAALYQAAIDSWSVLHTWKKVRWSLCAISIWGDIDLLKGANGYSAFSLYAKCWLEQKPLPGKQPISPCSARVTDPDASPWNYQP